MSDPRRGDVTQLLHDWSGGRQEALDELFPLVYAELKAMAGRQLRRERKDHTLQATALVHEAYLKLVGQHRGQWQDRAHFFAIAARVMRRILVDHARRHQASKRAGGQQKVSLEHAPELSSEPSMDFLALDEALTKLGQLDERQVKVVELRYFGGLTVPETAEVLGISEATVAREWRMARVWLYRELHGAEADQETGDG
jgi:RNA polymerase sigma factor (TIGR02999 family)